LALLVLVALPAETLARVVGIPGSTRPRTQRRRLQQMVPLPKAARLIQGLGLTVASVERLLLALVPPNTQAVMAASRSQEPATMALPVVVPLLMMEITALMAAAAAAPQTTVLAVRVVVVRVA
jgi:hypothetical protein